MVRTAELLSFNKEDIMTEKIYTLQSGWDLSLEEIKRIMNRLMSLGVSYIIYMTAFYSKSEGRKDFPIGYPPSHGYNNPLFRHYSTLTDYAAVRASLMTKTKPMGSSLVLLPPERQCGT